MVYTESRISIRISPMFHALGNIRDWYHDDEVNGQVNGLIECRMFCKARKHLGSFRYADSAPQTTVTVESRLSVALLKLASPSSNMPPRPFPFALDIGTDICCISRIRELVTRRPANGSLLPFVKKFLTTREQDDFFYKFTTVDLAVTKNMSPIYRYLAGRSVATF